MHNCAVFILFLTGSYFLVIGQIVVQDHGTTIAVKSGEDLVFEIENVPRFSVEISITNFGRYFDTLYSNTSDSIIIGYDETADQMRVVRSLSGDKILLYINDALYTHAATYTFELSAASSGINSAERYEFTLIVYDAPTCSSNTTSLTEGDTLTFDCRAIFARKDGGGQSPSLEMTTSTGTLSATTAYDMIDDQKGQAKSHHEAAAQPSDNDEVYTCRLTVPASGRFYSATQTTACSISYEVFYAIRSVRFYEDESRLNQLSENDTDITLYVGNYLFLYLDGNDADGATQVLWQCNFNEWMSGSTQLMLTENLIVDELTYCIVNASNSLNNESVTADISFRLIELPDSTAGPEAAIGSSGSSKAGIIAGTLSAVVAVGVVLGLLARKAWLKRKTKKDQSPVELDGEPDATAAPAFASVHSVTELPTSKGDDHPVSVTNAENPVKAAPESTAQESPMNNRQWSPVEKPMPMQDLPPRPVTSRVKDGQETETIIF